MLKRLECSDGVCAGLTVPEESSSAAAEEEAEESEDEDEPDDADKLVETEELSASGRDIVI